jgi:hypothetical protein
MRVGCGYAATGGYRTPLVLGGVDIPFEVDSMGE